jgi:hypothetical protein
MPPLLNVETEAFKVARANAIGNNAGNLVKSSVGAIITPDTAQFQFFQSSETDQAISSGVIIDERRLLTPLIEKGIAVVKVDRQFPQMWQLLESSPQLIGDDWVRLLVVWKESLSKYVAQ